MKLTVEVECTPAEAREYMGLPDLQPMQVAVMADIEKRIRRELDRFSPETVLTNWTCMPEHAERLWKMFGEAFGVVSRPGALLNGGRFTKDLCRNGERS
jgi:Family of unknown function (DUF6489)